MSETPKEPEPLPENVTNLPLRAINDTTLNLSEFNFVDANGNRGPREPTYEERLKTSREIERLSRIVEVMELMDADERRRALRYLASLYPQPFTFRI